MAIKTKAQIQVESNVTYIDNTVGSITPANVRGFNTNWIDSTIYVEQTGSMTVATASLALTASFLVGTISSASYALNAELLDGLDSTAFVGTASFNASTASFNTTSASLSTRVTSLESFSSSLDATFATDAQLNAATQSLSASTSTVNTRLTEVSSSLLVTSASLLQVSASYIALSASYNVFSGSASTRITNTSQSLQAVSASGQQVSASYIALSASYNVFSGSTSATLTAVSSSNQQLSASYIALSGSYNVFSGSASTRITNTEITASNLSAASASFSTRVTDNTSNIQTLTSATASYAVLANNQTFSGKNTFNNDVTASNVRITGTASIAFLDVQFQSSSVIYSSGSNQFGDASNDTQTLFGTVNVVTGPLVVTGSVNVSGSITVFDANNSVITHHLKAPSTNGVEILNNSNGVVGLFGAGGSLGSTFYGQVNATALSGSGALVYGVVSSSFASTANTANTATSASFASTASFANNAEFAVSASLAQFAGIASAALTASYATTASSAEKSFEAVSSSYAFTASSAISASFAQNAGTASVLLGAVVSSSYAFTASSAEKAFEAVSSSYAFTASSATSASYALNAGLLDGLDSSVFATTGSNSFKGTQTIQSGSELRTNSIRNAAPGENIVISFLSGANLRINATNPTFNGVFINGVLQVTENVGITGSLNVSRGITGSLFGNATSASYAATASVLLGSVVSSSYAFTASSAEKAFEAVSSSYALTASFALNGGGGSAFPYTGSAEISGSLSVTGSVNVSSALEASIVKAASYLAVNTIYDYSGGTIILEPASRTIAKTLLQVTGSFVVTGSLVSQPVSQSVSSLTASLDLTAGNFFNLTLPASANTYITASGQLPGQTINLKITQGATTGSVTFGAGIKQVSGSGYTATAVASAVDIVTFISFDNTGLYVSNVNNLV